MRLILLLALTLGLLSCSAKKHNQGANLHSYSVVKRSKGASSMLKGMVKGYDGRPALEAQVLSLGRGQGAKVLTDESGYFEMSVASGELQLDITSVDYGSVRTKPLLVAPKEVVELDIVLGAEKGVHKAHQKNEAIDETVSFLEEISRFFMSIIGIFTAKKMPS